MSSRLHGSNFEINSVDDIKTLFKDLKQRRVIITWAEFADKVEYDRTYVSRVINGHEPLTEDFKAKIKKTFRDVTKNVASGEKGVFNDLHFEDEDLGKIIGELKEENIELKARVTVLSVALAKVISVQTGKAIVDVVQELSEAFDLEIAKILLELKKKH
jgi:hypothetical protein